jgi:hypothetical protein
MTFSPPRAAISWSAGLIVLFAGCSGGLLSSPAPRGGSIGVAVQSHASFPYLRYESALPPSVGDRASMSGFGISYPALQGTNLPSYVYTCTFYNAPPYQQADGCEVWSGSGYGMQHGLAKTMYPHTANPQGDAITADGTLLIADTSNSAIDSMRHANHGAPKDLSVCVSEPGEWPAFVDATKGAALIAISNIHTTTTGNGSLAVAKGCGSTAIVLKNFDAHAVQGIGVAINRDGDCFWTYNDYTVGGAGYVARYAKCKGTGKRLPQYGLYGNTHMGFAGGIAFDKQNNMYLNDQTHGIWECPVSSKYYSCSELVYTGISGVEDNLGLNFNKDWTYLFWSDEIGNQICYTPTPVTNTQICVKNSIDSPPAGIALFKPSAVGK